MQRVVLGLAIVVALALLGWLLLAPKASVAPAREPGASKETGPPAGPAEVVRAGGRTPTPPSGAATTGASTPGSPAPLASGSPPTGPAGPSTSNAREQLEAARPAPASLLAAPSAMLHKPGQLSVDAVRAGIDAARPAVKACYEQALERKAELTGKLMVKFVVAQDDGKGRILEADIDEESSDEAMLNPFLGMCVLKALGEVEYPAPEGDGEVVVRFPFKFEPAEARAADDNAGGAR